MSAASSRRIRSVLIANRGEIALRIVRGVRTAGLRAIVAASEVDQDTPATRLANEVAFLGPAPPHESYLHIDRIIAAARRHAVDAIHPGYGFLAEDAAFAKRVEDEGFVFLGPTSEQIARLGDKLAARREVARAGIGPVPGSDRALRGREDLERIEAEIGLPLLLKASGGGGGRGIRIARSRAELAPLFALAASKPATPAPTDASSPSDTSSADGTSRCRSSAMGGAAAASSRSAIARFSAGSKSSSRRPRHRSSRLECATSSRSPRSSCCARHPTADPARSSS